MLFISIFLAIFTLMACSNETTAKSEPQTSKQIDKSEETIKEIEIVAKTGPNPEDFVFEPAEVTVKEGETVNITLKSADQVKHELWLPKIKGARVASGESVQFTPEQAGEYLGSCSELCGVGHAIMSFKLIVQ
ncbi:hypothetical protein D0469_07130 [Peribacillus saganii]|uniref:Cytochrome oxidase subunit II copper A binding domain-containing protein n=2 Tax=Peribacillus saganii TaxID=2303992 RepID=A0A372LR07_9BACI|nr:hypothetical protein D0469_07130 [Peribacillus saganii]